MGLPKKKKGWTVCRLKGGLSKKEECGIFEGEGGDTSMHTMYKPISYRQKIVTSNNLPGIEE